MRMLFCFLLLAVAALANADEAPEFQTQVTGRIEIAPDGTVSSFKLDERLSAAIRHAVDRNIRSWRFEPVIVEGRPVIAATTLRLQLEAVPVGADYVLRVAKVWFGEPQRAHSMQAPAYPPDAQREGIQGRVTLVLRLDGSGNVTDAHAEQTSLSVTTKGKRGQHWRNVFESASLQAAKAWKFTMTEIVDGNPVGGSIRVPIDYAFKGDAWARYIPGAISPAPWAEQARVAVDASQTPDQLQPLDSRFRLKDGIVGSTL